MRQSIKCGEAELVVWVFRALDGVLPGRPAVACCDGTVALELRQLRPRGGFVVCPVSGRDVSGTQCHVADPCAGQCRVRADATSVGLRCRKARALRGQACDLDSDLDSSCTRAFQPCMSPTDRVSLVSDMLTVVACPSNALGGTYSCGLCMNIHVVRVRTGIHVRHVVGMFLGEQSLEYEYSEHGSASGPVSLQQASASLYGEGWAGRVGCSSLRGSWEVEIEWRCVVTVSYLPSLDFGTSLPGRGKEVRSWIGWTPLGETARSGVPCRRRGVFSSLSAAGDGVKQGLVPHTVGGTSTFIVFLFIFILAGHSCRATNWRAVLATA